MQMCVAFAFEIRKFKVWKVYRVGCVWESVDATKKVCGYRMCRFKDIPMRQRGKAKQVSEKRWFISLACLRRGVTSDLFLCKIALRGWKQRVGLMASFPRKLPVVVSLVYSGTTGVSACFRI